MSNEHLRLFNGMDTILELRVGAVPKLGVESRCLNHPVLHRGVLKLARKLLINKVSRRSLC